MKLENASVYVVHGWKVEGEKMEKCLMNLSPEVIELGLRLVFPRNQKAGFFGEILAKVDEGENFDAVRVVPPVPDAGKRLAKAMEVMGLKADAFDMPLLWVIAG